MWRDSRKERSLWHEDGVWYMSDMNMVDYATAVDEMALEYASDTFADCPELVENWIGFPSSFPTTIEKITCQNIAEK